MQMIKKMVTAGAIAVAGLGVGTAGASAYSISGGSYVGTATGTHSYSIAGAYTITCPAASTTFSGSATGADTTSFTPSYGGGAAVCSFFGLPVSVSQSGTWDLRVTGGPSVGWYSGEVYIPAGTTTVINIPFMGCVQTISGPQTFRHGVGSNVVRMRNVTPTGVELEGSATGIAFTASGCPFSGGSGGGYTTGGLVTIPGITVS